MGEAGCRGFSRNHPDSRGSDLAMVDGHPWARVYPDKERPVPSFSGVELLGRMEESDLVVFGKVLEIWK